MTDTPAPATLTERARAAAAGRTDTHDPAWSDAHWIARAHRCAQRLALVLAVPVDRVVIEATTMRRYGGWPWPQLTITDAGATFRFVAMYADPNHITALQPCPFCENEVPTFPISTLADLGDLLSGDTDDDPVDARLGPRPRPDLPARRPHPLTATRRARPQAAPGATESRHLR
jgi:hypothetical protein